MLDCGWHDLVAWTIVTTVLTTMIFFMASSNVHFMHTSIRMPIYGESLSQKVESLQNFKNCHPLNCKLQCNATMKIHKLL